MSSKSDWLSGISEIFGAKTGDLKKLAKLAGEDPRTLFIGTSMNGTDVRGQDLTGIIFTHLDLNSVNYDSSTTFDKSTSSNQTDDQSIELDLNQNAALAFFSSERLVEEFRGRPQRKTPNVKSYGPREEADFRRDVLEFDGPKFVVADARRGKVISNLPRIHSASIVTLIACRDVDADAYSLFPTEIANSASGPLVLVPVSAFGVAGYTPTIAGALTDALALFIANWPTILEIASQAFVTAFFRAKGSGSRPVVDAWSRVLARVSRSDLVGWGGWRVALVSGHAPSEWGMDEAFFPRMTQVPFSTSPGTKSVDAAVLIDIASAPPFSQAEAYQEVIGLLLERNGWNVRRDFDSRHSHTIGLLATGEKRVYRLSIEHERPRGPAPEVYEGNLPPLDHDLIDRIVVSEAATERQVLFHLVDKRELWVSARDIANFTPGNPSIWTLLGHQFRRLARSVDSVGRTQYSNYLFRMALERGRIHNPPSPRAWEALHDSDFSKNFTVTCGAVRQSGEIFLCNMKLAPRNDGNRGATFATFTLMIDPDGPSLEDFRDIPQSKRAPSDI